MALTQLFTAYTVSGTPDPVKGFIIDAKNSVIIKERVIEDLDHSNLNLDVAWIPEGMQPTTENLTILIWQRLEPFITDGCLHYVQNS